MTSGEVFAAFVNGVHVLRLTGDVRLNLCSAFEHYLDEILKRSDFTNVVIDLSDAQGVDSTTLGQIAKVAIICRERFDITPTIASPNPSITRILLSMGFDQVFHIVDQAFTTDVEFDRWVAGSVDQEEAREQVIAAHKVLMSMNDANANTFKALVDSLEADRPDRYKRML